MQMTIRTLFAYDQWAHEQVWKGVLTLDDEQFVRPFDYSLGSVRQQLVHLVSVQHRWLARVAGQPVAGHLKPEDYPSAAAFWSVWETLSPAHQAIVDGLTDAQLVETIAYDMPSRGGAKQSARWEILAHVVNHGTDHRAQILSLLFRLGAPTVEQDLILYLWEQQGQ